MYSPYEILGRAATIIFGFSRVNQVELLKERNMRPRYKLIVHFDEDKKIEKLYSPIYFTVSFDLAQYIAKEIEKEISKI